MGGLDHVQNRINIWLDPMAYYDQTPGSGQLVEGLFGMAWGGLIGRGFGGGSPERVPFAESDFIVAAIGEELGLTGVIAVILLYGLMVERALRVALISRDGFGKLVAVGLAGVLALQVFVVVGGVTRLIPLTGLTTPFLSYGGSSLVANWVIVALLLRISDQARSPVPDLDRGRRRRRADHPGDPGGCNCREQAHPHHLLFCLLLFLALMANATWLQYSKSDAYDEDPRNRRVIEAAYSGERGAILVGREPVAESKPFDDQYEFLREYPEPVKYAHRHRLLLLFSQTGIEQTQNDVLSGDDDLLFVTKLVDLLSSKAGKGGNVQLTIDRDAQDAAFDALNDLPGQVRGLGRRDRAQHRPDPGDGVAADLRPQRAGLPRLPVGPTPTKARAGRERAAAQPRDPDQAAAGLDLQAGDRCRRRSRTATTTPTAKVPGGPTYQLPQTSGSSGEIDNEGRDCGTDKIPFSRHGELLQHHLRPARVELGADELHEQAEAFGFNQDYFEDLGLQCRVPTSPTARTRRRPVSSASASSRVWRLRCRWRWSPPGSPTGDRDEALPRRRGPLAGARRARQAEPEELNEAVSASTADQLAD